MARLPNNLTDAERMMINTTIQDYPSLANADQNPNNLVQVIRSNQFQHPFIINVYLNGPQGLPANPSRVWLLSAAGIATALK